MSFAWTLDLLFVIIAVIFIALGVWRGFIKSLIRSAKFILAVLIAYLLGGYLGLFFKDAFVGDMVYSPVNDWVNEAYESTEEAVNADELLESLPSFAVTDDVKDAIHSANAEESGEQLVETVSNAIADPIATAISNVLGYIAVFLLSLILLSIAAWLLTKLADSVVFLGVINRILGGAWGAVTAFLLLLVLTSVIKAFWSADPLYLDSVIVKFFGESGLLKVFGFLDVGNILS